MTINWSENTYKINNAYAENMVNRNTLLRNTYN